ncbi:hypothetical protein [Saezia sanguinis]|uniref:hypothetical protein n=1 Tax=Saezia sanguinis TaxID=1965230 RepID=UPI0030685F86
MIKKRWLKHLLAGLCLLMAIPAFAQEKYFIRVSDYMNSLNPGAAIDSVSNLCKLNPTYGAYATGEHTYPGTLPRVGIYVQCSMENPNSTFKSFGMDVYCPKGFSHRSMVGIENGLEEGCYSQMTCEAAAEAGLQRPQECCVPIPLPVNDTLCPAQPPTDKNGDPFAGLVACNSEIRRPCVWTEHNGNPQDPQAKAFINHSTFIHETFHQNDGTLTCIQGGKYAGFVGGVQGYDFLSEVNASEAQLIYLEDVKKECCTSLCTSEIKDFQEFISGYKKMNEIEYCEMSITGISSQIDCSAYTEE